MIGDERRNRCFIVTFKHDVCFVVDVKSRRFKLLKLFATTEELPQCIRESPKRLLVPIDTLHKNIFFKKWFIVQLQINRKQNQMLSDVYSFRPNIKNSPIHL